MWRTWLVPSSDLYPLGGIPGNRTVAPHSGRCISRAHGCDTTRATSLPGALVGAAIMRYGNPHSPFRRDSSLTPVLAPRLVASRRRGHLQLYLSVTRGPAPRQRVPPCWGSSLGTRRRPRKMPADARCCRQDGFHAGERHGPVAAQQTGRHGRAVGATQHRVPAHRCGHR